MDKKTLIDAINATPARSHYARGVKKYAVDLVAGCNFDELQSSQNFKDCQKALLRGADNWRHFCLGGCGLRWDCDIAERLAPPSKRVKIGRGTYWLDREALACYDAASLIWRALRL